MCVMAISHLKCTCLSTLGPDRDCSSPLMHLVFSFQDESILDLHYFINVQGLRGEGREVKSLQEGDISNDEICEIFGPREDKNG